MTGGRTGRFAIMPSDVAVWPSVDVDGADWPASTVGGASEKACWSDMVRAWKGLCSTRMLLGVTVVRSKVSDLAKARNASVRLQKYSEETLNRKTDHRERVRVDWV